MQVATGERIGFTIADRPPVAGERLGNFDAYWAESSYGYKFWCRLATKRPAFVLQVGGRTGICSCEGVATLTQYWTSGRMPAWSHLEEHFSFQALSFNLTECLLCDRLRGLQLSSMERECDKASPHLRLSTKACRQQFCGRSLCKQCFLVHDEPHAARIRFVESQLQRLGMNDAMLRAPMQQLRLRERVMGMQQDHLSEVSVRTCAKPAPGPPHRD